jgi:hypothetical protein
MSIPTGVDGDAPVRAHHETDIDAPMDTVWQLHADVNAWPAWQTDITAAHIDGLFQPGASFEWSSYGFTVVSTIYAVVERAVCCGVARPPASPESTNGSSARHLRACM